MLVKTTRFVDLKETIHTGEAEFLVVFGGLMILGAIVGKFLGIFE
jgi:hypothetical protein